MARRHPFPQTVNRVNGHTMRERSCLPVTIKKIFCGLMVLLMAATFAGCGENSPRQRVTQTVTAALTAPNEVLQAVLSLSLIHI